MEYVGVLALVSAIAVTAISAGIPTVVSGEIEQAVCRIYDGDNCADDSAAAEQSGGRPPQAIPQPPTDPPTGESPGAGQQGQPPLQLLTGRSGTPESLAARPDDGTPPGNDNGERPPPWETSDGTPCWGVECDFVEDPLPLDGLDPNDWGAEHFPWTLEPAQFDFDEGKCLVNCGRFIEEIDRRVQACMGGPIGFFRGAFNACARDKMERELVEDIEQAFLDENPDIREALEEDPTLGAPVPPGQVPTPRISQHGLDHSFNRPGHADRWFGRPVSKDLHYDEWRSVIERALRSNKVVNWSTGTTPTHGRLARIDGKYIFVQTDRATGELVTAFIPSQAQLRIILYQLGIIGG